jgi:hypothetical protein
VLSLLVGFLTCFLPYSGCPGLKSWPCDCNRNDIHKITDNPSDNPITSASVDDFETSFCLLDHAPILAAASMTTTPVRLVRSGCTPKLASIKHANSNFPPRKYCRVRLGCLLKYPKTWLSFLRSSALGACTLDDNQLIAVNISFYVRFAKNKNLAIMLWK